MAKSSRRPDLNEPGLDLVSLTSAQSRLCCRSQLLCTPANMMNSLSLFCHYWRGGCGGSRQHLEAAEKPGQAHGCWPEEGDRLQGDLETLSDRKREWT
jgi:hypothetical protein